MNDKPSYSEIVNLALDIKRRRGPPPYTAESLQLDLTDDEAWLISDFVANWQTHLAKQDQGGNS